MKIITMLYGLACYGLSLVALTLFMLFANNHMGVLGIESLESLNIDQLNGPPASSPLLINLGLLLLFGIQHSVMARPGFKQALTRFLPAAWERSTYVLATSVVLLAIVQYWQPMGGQLWEVHNPAARLALEIAYFWGWGITVLATFMLNHFHLFGLQQSLNPENPDAGTKEFKTPLFYSVVRHPIQTGIVIAMVATPDMTTGRAVLAVGMLIYIAVGLYFEERDLVEDFGDTYRDYRERVPGVLPFLKLKRDNQPTQAETP